VQIALNNRRRPSVGNEPLGDLFGNPALPNADRAGHGDETRLVGSGEK
jgi:hypothetical protein